MKRSVTYADYVRPKNKKSLIVSIIFWGVLFLICVIPDEHKFMNAGYLRETAWNFLVAVVIFYLPWRFLISRINKSYEKKCNALAVDWAKGTNASIIKENRKVYFSYAVGRYKKQIKKYHDRIVRNVDKITEIIPKIESNLSSISKNFIERKYSPFWMGVENIWRLVEDFEYLNKEISSDQSFLLDLIDTASGYEFEAPQQFFKDFPMVIIVDPSGEKHYDEVVCQALRQDDYIRGLLEELPCALEDSDKLYPPILGDGIFTRLQTVLTEMASLLDSAFSDFEFSSIYEQRQTQQTIRKVGDKVIYDIREGFAKLSDGICNTIVQSTDLMITHIDSLSENVDSLSRSVNQAKIELLEAHRAQLRQLDYVGRQFRHINWK